MKYKYWSNKNDWHDSLLFECQAETISEADQLFTAATGIDPIRAPWVGCQVFKDQDGLPQ